MFTTIWNFLTKPEVFKPAMKVLIAVLAATAVDGAFNALLPLEWAPVVKALSYATIGLTAAHSTRAPKEPNDA